MSTGRKLEVIGSLQQSGSETFIQDRSNIYMSRELTDRQETILKMIIERYVADAQPVGSTTLANSDQLDVSSATVRNEMATLEKAGFIRQPYTSAGRVPTEQAYVYYLHHFVQAKQFGADKEKLKQSLRKAKAKEEAVKDMAKTLVDLSGEMVIVALGPHWTYYTGVSNLFQKPDFRDLEHVRSISKLIDAFDEVLYELAGRVSDEPEVMIGSDNPFGEEMSSIVVHQSWSADTGGLLGLVGPLRMDYEKNIGLIQEAKQIIENEPNTYDGGQKA